MRARQDSKAVKKEPKINDKTTLSGQADKKSRSPAWQVRQSSVHGKGVFSNRLLATDTRLMEYKGERISAQEMLEREGSATESDPCHTFYFSLEDGSVIDGGRNGNAARWINHACNPNCQAKEENGRIYIYTSQVLQAGDELFIDYQLALEGRHTPTLKKAYQCCCGADNCRKTMLAPRRKK